MEKIIMSSSVLVVTKINRKTKAQMFGGLKVGSKIQLSIPVKYAGIGRGTHASYIESKNLETGETNRSSFNQLPNILDAFEFEELVEKDAMSKVFTLLRDGEVMDVFSTYELANKAKYGNVYDGHWDSFEIKEHDFNKSETK